MLGGVPDVPAVPDVPKWKTLKRYAPFNSSSSPADQTVSQLRRCRIKNRLIAAGGETWPAA